ncbi:hypothetical protein ACXR8U_06515 [Methylobacterium radiotolerans]|uniref:hypothetical protein n=1 Tax=Methylobacterium TaxID=407 RepID=UPI0005E71464|nr:hypothetical protein [Methylobacterium radiotolerans]MBN6822511.1 hypothetical protein [Methylobacterium organophilum]OXE40036.1 hypothetical protein CCS92_20835 [Methylobacterium radiotolerans]GAN47812.1 hypothetical protein ME121_1823 [Methylobacterium sp. ME121]
MKFSLTLALALLASPAAGQTFTLPFSKSVANSGQPGLQGMPLFLSNSFGGATFDDRATLRVDRDVETASGGGKPWWTYKAFWANTTTSYVSPGFEWTITGELNNRSRKSANAQNVAVNGTAWKKPTDNGEETGTTWAGNFNCVDQTGKASPTTSCIALELDIGGVVGPDPNRQRVLSHAGGGGEPGSHVAYGYMVSTSQGVTIDRAFSTANVGSTFGIGLDLAGASFSGAAILMAPGQWIGLDGNADGKFSRFLGFNPVDGSLTYMTSGGPMIRIADDGAAYVGRLVETIPHVPASSSAPCVIGERAWDQSYEYRCVAPNRWKRAALSDW